jgi:hypothetical protein
MASRPVILHSRSTATVHVQDLGSPPQPGKVEAQHQIQRVAMVAESKTFEELLRRADRPESVWTSIDKSPQLHDESVDLEFDVLEKLATRKPVDAAVKFSATFGEKGSHPDPTVFREHFSAALEYLEASVAKFRDRANPRKVRNAPNPRKNDRGQYGDFNLLFYLADPNIKFLTDDRRMLDDIRVSPQRTRIVGIEGGSDPVRCSRHECRIKAPGESAYREFRRGILNGRD